MLNFFLKFLLSLSLLSSGWAVTEFICKVNDASGNDYTTVHLWESAMGIITTFDDTRVFSISSETGTVGDGASVTGATSSATGTVVHVTTTQVLIHGITGTFQSGENVEVDASNYVVLSDAGDDAHVVLEVHSDGGEIDVGAGDLYINGIPGDAGSHIIIRGKDGERHDGTGIYGNGARMKSTGQFDEVIRTIEEYVYIEWLQLKREYSAASQGTGVVRLGQNNNHVRNCVITAPDSGHGVFDQELNSDSQNYIYNNIFNDIDYHGYYNNAFGATTGSTDLLNNTFYLCGKSGSGFNAIKIDDTTQQFDITNNMCVMDTSAGDCYSVGGATFTTNGADDATGSSGLQSLDTAEFVSTTTDLRLASGADSIDAGTDLDTTPSGIEVDIDATPADRNSNATWDIGADEREEGGGGPTPSQTQSLVFG